MAYRHSDELRLRPSVVRSVPSASVFRSWSVMRMTESSPIRPYRSVEPSSPEEAPLPRPWPPSLPRPPSPPSIDSTPRKSPPMLLPPSPLGSPPPVGAGPAPGRAGKSSFWIANSDCGGSCCCGTPGIPPRPAIPPRPPCCSPLRNCRIPEAGALPPGRLPSDGKSLMSKEGVDGMDPIVCPKSGWPGRPRPPEPPGPPWPTEGIPGWFKPSSKPPPSPLPCCPAGSG